MNPGSRLIGYFRVSKRDDLYTCEDPQKLESFCTKKGASIVSTESEVSAGNQIVRVGLWKALRKMLCSQCEPRQMPMLNQYEDWMRELNKSCSCKSAKPCDGIVVTDMRAVTTDMAQGARFTLDLCAAGKHLVSLAEEKCLSCCNPQAVAFLRKSILP
ncbi:MAG: hypothetical protein K2X27_08625 [Candidatus Obscuribacterales bacterium]|nr:hypothetical protein [Candidatus Obscuribacterales bacterium]